MMNDDSRKKFSGKKYQELNSGWMKEKFLKIQNHVFT